MDSQRDSCSNRSDSIESTRGLTQVSRRARARQQTPTVEVLPADARAANPQNPYDQVGTAGRWTARVRVLSARIVQDWDELAKISGVEMEVIMDGERLITAREAWERMAISERGWYRFVKQASLPCYRIGRVVRYKWSDIERVSQTNCGASPNAKPTG